MAVGEQHHRIAEARARRLDRHGLAGDALQLACRPGIETAAFAEFGEHRAGLHGGQLILVAEQDQPRLRWQCDDQLGHQRQVDHRRLVHHQHVQRQRIGRIVAHTGAVAAAAEQAVQGPRLVRQGLFHRIADRQLGLGVADRLGHARRGLAGGCGEADGQALAARLLEQRRQQAHHGGGLASAGTAGDHRQASAYRLRGGQALPVGALLIEGEQARQTVTQPSFIDIRCVRRASQQLFGQLLFVGLVAGQVKPVAEQGQRCVVVWCTDQRRGFELSAPNG